MDRVSSKNHLGTSSSPYLLQHKDNPVHWYPWGEDALTLARETDRPILLSIGYAACHWCHVMAHESFEDESTASLMNAHFINIKVDREERPDIDHLYMSALHALGEQGGWPLTMFLTPEALPFWGGTYFPPRARYGRPGFPDVLREIDRTWRERRFSVEKTGRSLSDALLHRGGDMVLPADWALLDHAAQQLLGMMDSEAGGTRGAPKFPNAPLLELFERAYERTGHAAYADIVDLTLEKMCLGGIYDHIGGGLARYATDEAWLVPHFEKMLYDNAQFIDLLASAWVRSGRELFRIRAEETLAWMLRDLRSSRPAFASSLDADSGHGEGAFYVWTPNQIKAVLGDAANAFCSEYDVTPEGNWEGVSIPNRLQKNKDGLQVEPISSNQRDLLRVSRETRPRPATDDKLIADWNALTVTALARGSLIFDQPCWAQIAKSTYHFIYESMLNRTYPVHTLRQGIPGPPAIASDYAAMADAALALYQIDGDELYLLHSATLLDTLHSHFRDRDTGLYGLAHRQAPDMPLHIVATQDEATPNLHGQALSALIRLGLITGVADWLERADDLIERLTAPAIRNVYGHASILNALDLRLNAVQIMVLGDEMNGKTKALLQAARALSPRKTIITHYQTSDGVPTNHPAFGKSALRSQPIAYVCVGQTCSLPLSDPSALVAAARQPPA